MTGPTATPGDETEKETVDPVCGEVFPPELAVFHSEHGGRRYFFCSSTCKREFDASPAEHAAATEGAR